MNGSSAQFNAIVTIVGSVLLLAYTPPDTGVTAAFLHDGPALLLGLFLGIVGTTSGLAAVWLLAGGKASIIQLGFGAPRWLWITPAGTLLALSRLPVAVSADGIGRWLRFPRVPFVAGLTAAGAVLAFAVSRMHDGLSPQAWGWSYGAVLIATGTLVPLRGTWWIGAFAGQLPVVRMNDQLRRANLLLDADTVLRLTEPSDAVSRTYRAWALSRRGRYDEAIVLARDAVAADGDPSHLHVLALLRHTAMEAGDPAGVAARHELDQLAEALDDPAVPDMLRWDVEAVAALAHGDYDGAERLATSIIARVPRRHRAHAWCTIARAQAGMARFDEARKSLARARKDDPDEPRIPYAEAAITRVESGEDLTAASH